MPKFTSEPGSPDLRMKVLPPGTPSRIPLSSSRSVGGVAAYETLFSFEGPEGEPRAAAYPGTYEVYLGLAAGRGR